jgi:ribosomal protein S18 acetylase RimI-like enzyme
MDIRLLNRTDIDAFKVIRLNALKNNPEAFGSSYEEEVEFSDERFLKRLENENARTFGVFEEKKLVGLCTLMFQPRKKMNHRADIYSMYVEPHMRQKGIGRLLVTKAIEMARATNTVEQIYLTVVSTNESAKGLYQSLGFKTFGIEERAMKYEEVYYDHELMVLFLRDE